jgi:hypothetical protein
VEKARDVDGKIGGKDGGMGNWGEVMEEVEVEELVVWFVVPPLSDSLTDFFFQNQDIRCFFRIFQHRYTIEQSRYSFKSSRLQYHRGVLLCRAKGA